MSSEMHFPASEMHFPAFRGSARTNGPSRWRQDVVVAHGERGLLQARRSVEGKAEPGRHSRPYGVF